MVAIKQEPLLSESFVAALAEAQGWQDHWMTEVEPKARGRGAKAAAMDLQRDANSSHRIPDMLMKAAGQVHQQSLTPLPPTTSTLQPPPPALNATSKAGAPSQPLGVAPVAKAVAPMATQAAVPMAGAGVTSTPERLQAAVPIGGARDTSMPEPGAVVASVPERLPADVPAAGVPDSELYDYIGCTVVHLP